MHLTRAADYGVRVMIHLVGKGAGTRASLGTLSGATGAPESFLSKVLQALAHGGLLVSQRGQAGGFEVSARGFESSMRDVIEAVDGPIYLNTCVTSGKTCPRQSWCPAHPVWVDAQQALLKVLDDARIQDLANGQASLQSPFGALQCVAPAAAATVPNGCACEMSAVGHS